MCSYNSNYSCSNLEKLDISHLSNSALKVDAMDPQYSVFNDSSVFKTSCKTHALIEDTSRHQQTRQRYRSRKQSPKPHKCSVNMPVATRLYTVPHYSLPNRNTACMACVDVTSYTMRLRWSADWRANKCERVSFT